MGKSSLPPRVVDLGLLKDIKQVDFVTYIPNPHFRRDKPRGEAARLIAALRNQRLQPRPDTMNGCVVRAASRLSNLPSTGPV